MVRVYFDTNVYDWIDKGQVPAEEVEALQAALTRGEIVAHLSLADIEELLGQWDTARRADAIRRLRVARDLVGFDGLLKSPATLLTEAIHAYATGEAVPSPLLPPDQLRCVAAYLNDVLDGETSRNTVTFGIVGEVRQSKREFLRNGPAGEEVSGELDSSGLLEEAKRYASTFETFWEKAAPLYAEDFAARLGLAGACRDRGLDGLLRVRPVRLSVGVALSLVFSQVIEGCTPNRGDGYDLWHAVQASIADVFVTFDLELVRHLARVPVDGFRVVTSVRDLLA